MQLLIMQLLTFDQCKPSYLVAASYIHSPTSEAAPQDLFQHWALRHHPISHIKCPLYNEKASHKNELFNGRFMHLSMISPIPPTWGGVGDMWGLGHTICVPWWGKVQLTVWGSKFNFLHGFNQDSTIHCKN